MNYKIELSSNFKKEAKKLVKKYPFLKTELIKLFSELEKNPTLGIPLGDNIYKINWLLLQKTKESLGVQEFYRL